MHEGGFDVAVVGGGPAGLAAAVGVGRLNRRALVLEAGVPRTAHATCYHNYLGFPDGLSGERLLDLGHRQAERWGATFRERAVVAAAPTSKRGRRRFRIELGDETVETAAGIILATGVKDCQPSCGPLYDATASGIHYCAICDGRETTGARTAVVGRDSRAVDMAGALRDFTTDLHLLLDDERDALTAEARTRLASWGIEIVAGCLESVELVDSMVRFRGADGTPLQFEHVFLALGVVPRTRVAESLGCALDAEGYVRTEDSGGTTVPFVFAAGDCSGGLKQVTQAMAEGERAAIGLCKALREEDGPAIDSER